MERIAYSLLRLECPTPEGTSYGTGFLFEGSKDAARSVPLLITNKHVVEESTGCILHFGLADAQGVPVIGSKHRVEVADLSKWMDHPDPSVDLCALPLADIINEQRASGNILCYTTLAAGLIPSTTRLSEFEVAQDILLVGYPNGLWDEHNNAPIFRRGITATVPARDYDGRCEFLIDAACFSGSSGSPVFFHRPKLPFTAAGPISFTGNEAHVELLGVLYAGLMFDASGELVIKPVPTKFKKVVELEIPMHLGAVIRAEQLLAFVERIEKAMNVSPTGS